MNYEKLKSFRFWETLDKTISMNRFSGRRRESLYPSEASAIAIDPDTKKASVVGGCNRKVWYRLMGFQESNPNSLKSLYTFAFGNYIESFIQDLAKQAGIYNNSSVKFWDNSNYISGEMDLIVKHPVDPDGGFIFTEVKSTWGGAIRNGYEAGKAKDLFDHPEGRGKNKIMVKGIPKESNLLQLVTYLYTERDNPLLIGGKLVYLLRDNFSRTEFDVNLEYDETVKKWKIMVNGEQEKRFYADDIYLRFAELRSIVKASLAQMNSGTKREKLIPPPRDFTMEYTNEEAKSLHESGDLSKAKFDNHMGGDDKKAGDWQCSYCSFKDLCYSKAQSKLVAVSAQAA